jgi:PleD family two-component response regulator
MSAGVTQFRPQDGPDDALTREDVALYQAKNAGRNTVMSN